MKESQEKILSVLNLDPTLQPLISRLEFPKPLEGRDPYFDLIRSIVFQQLSVKAAQTIFERFISLFPNEWPNPESLIHMEHEKLRGAGLSRQKAGYLQNIARFFLEEDLMDGHWTNWEDEAIVQ